MCTKKDKNMQPAEVGPFLVGIICPPLILTTFNISDLSVCPLFMYAFNYFARLRMGLP
jgi:hypothetical protein